MKKLYIFSLIALVAFTAASENFTSLTLLTRDGKEINLSAENLTLTYADGALVCGEAAGNLRYEVASLQEMYFSDNTPLSIETAQWEEETAVTVYGLSGEPRGVFASEEEARKSLSSGPYLFKMREEVRKVRVK